MGSLEKLIQQSSPTSKARHHPTPRLRFGSLRFKGYCSLMRKKQSASCEELKHGAPGKPQEERTRMDDQSPPNGHKEWIPAIWLQACGRLHVARSVLWARLNQRRPSWMIREIGI